MIRDSPHRFLFLFIFLLAGCDPSVLSERSPAATPASPVSAISIQPTPQPPTAIATVLQDSQPPSPLITEPTMDSSLASSTALPTVAGTIVTAATLPPVLSTTVPSAAPAPNTSPSPVGWRTIAWEGVRIPIPPQAQWESQIATNPPIGDIPILATGAVTYPTITGTVELPFGPTFLILQFSGSLDDWINRERSRDPLAVNDQTVADTTIAGRPAKVYQPVVTGTCNSGAYIVALKNSHLLWIWNECLGYEPFDSIIQGLQIEASATIHAFEHS